MMTQTTISLLEIQNARARLDPYVRRSPLVLFDLVESESEIYLKLENLQPGGSFKLRGAGNAMLLLDRDQASAGVWTASAGNMGLALAWWAYGLQIPCTVVVPENTAQVKVAQIAAFGANIVPVPFSDYQQIQSTRKFPGMVGHLIHPFADPGVMAGNGTIGLEITEDLAEVNAVVVPYGGGGLIAGIASAIKAIQPAVKVYAAEVDTGAPFTASYQGGSPVEVPYSHSFVNGIGAPFLFPGMWALNSPLVAGSIAVSPAQIAEAIRRIAVQNHVIAEGAGAVAVAAAMTGQLGVGKIVCVVSGGNLDQDHLLEILQGRTPQVS
jgi:threonine dehydratase